jgi:hypothetical protein
MASNNKNTTKTTKTNNKTNAVNAVNAIVQPDAVTQLTALVKSLMAEISELKAKVNSEVAKPANKKDHIVSVVSVPANKTSKVNVVPPANGFILLAENESISEVVTISAIGSPFWGKGFNGRSVMKVAVNCVTALGNTIVVFLLLNRDAVGNTIGSGLVGGANYVMTGVASGKTSEFNNAKANIINKAKFSPVS